MGLLERKTAIITGGAQASEERSPNASMMKGHRLSSVGEDKTSSVRLVLLWPRMVIGSTK